MAVDTSVRTQEDELIARFIEWNPHKPGRADVRIVGSGVAVWAVIPELQAANGDVDAAAAAYDLTPEQVEAAAAYYRRNQAVIDARIEANML